jgi:hypothetical protein
MDGGALPLRLGIGTGNVLNTESIRRSTLPPVLLVANYSVLRS